MMFAFDYQTMPVVEIMEPYVLSKLMEYPAIPPTTISIEEFMSMGGITEEDNFTHLKMEVAVRLAHMIMELQHLPRELHAEERCHHTISLYSKSFSQIIELEEMEPDQETLAEFMELLVIFREGLNIPKEEISSRVFTSIKTFLGKLYNPSIFIHMTNNQNLAVYDYKNSDTNQIGFIQPNASVTSVREDTYDDAIFHTVNCYMVAPKVNIENNSSANLGSSEPAAGVLILDCICIIFYEELKSAIRAAIITHWDKRDGSPPMNEIVCQEIDVFTLKISGQGGKLDIVNAEKKTNHLYSTIPTHSESDSTAVERLPECYKESVRGAHHHQQSGTTPIQASNYSLRLLSMINIFEDLPEKIQHVLARNGLLTLILTCTVTTSSLTGINKSEENFVRFNRKGDVHGELYHCPLNMWPDAESVEDFVMRGDFHRMMGEFNTLTRVFIIYLVIFSDGRPAYWSENYSIRPFIKKLSRHWTSTPGPTVILYSMPADRAGKMPGGLALGTETSIDQQRKEMVGDHSIPREHSYTPVDTEIHKIEELARQELSDSMDLKETRAITTKDWLRICLENIAAHHQSRIAELKEMHWCILKLRPLQQIITCPATSSFSMSDFNKSKGGHIRFIKKASSIKKSGAHGELCRCLLWVLEDADADGNGLDSQASFSEPLVMAATIPREYNFAHEITELHGTNESKELARQQILDSMDLKEIAVVTNDEWLRFSLEHIAAKSATVDPHPILEHDNLEQFKEFLLTPVQSEAAKMPWALQGLFTEHHTVGNFPSMWDKIQASSISLKILSMISNCEEGLINWAEVFSMIVIATSCNTTDNIVDLSVATLARSSCSLSSPMSWVTKSGVFCSRCQDSDRHLDPYSQASLHTVALKLETTVFTHLFTMNMATYSSAKFSTVLGILLGQFENYTLQASRQNLKLISLHNSLEEWFDNARMVGNIDVINGAKAPIMLTYTGLEICSMTTESGWKDWVEVEVVSAIMNLATVCVGDSAWTIFVSQFTASGITTGNIMGRSMDAFAAFPCSVSSPMSQDPYSLASLTKEDLQLLTHACTLLFSKNMARVVVNTNEFTRSDISIMITYTVLGEDLERLTHDCTPLCTVNVAIHNFDRFSTVRSSPLPGWEVPIFRRVTAIWKKLISLHNTFEDGLDIAMLVDNINVMTRPTVPTVFTVTSLVMGYVIMESDEFFCRRAVLPPDSFVDVI